MTKSRRISAVHPGEILKTEFMEPMGVSAYALAKALGFPGIYEVVRGDRAISADTTVPACAVLAESVERLRPEDSRRQRRRPRDQASRGCGADGHTLRQF